MIDRIVKYACIVASLCLILSCEKDDTSLIKNKTWAEKLGFPKDKKVLILHADDLGMCHEANEAAKVYFPDDQIQSGSAMAPCPFFEELAAWYKNNSVEDIGLHLTLTSEWKTYRWGPVSNPQEVPGLIDSDGYLWRDVLSVVQHATPDEVEKEIRAQIEKALSLGIKPGHIDTHMGTLYASLGFTKAYLSAAMEYQIPAMVIEFSEPVIERFRGEGYPITDELIQFATDYTLPKLDDFYSVPDGSSYEDKKQKFFDLVRSLKPGITEIIFHPSIETDNLKTITNSWQQRVWEAKLFSDPEVIQFFKNEGVLFTNWKEMMMRFREKV